MKPEQEEAENKVVKLKIHNLIVKQKTIWGYRMCQYVESQVVLPTQLLEYIRKSWRVEYRMNVDQSSKIWKPTPPAGFWASGFRVDHLFSIIEVGVKELVCIEED